MGHITSKVQSYVDVKIAYEQVQRANQIMCVIDTRDLHLPVFATRVIIAQKLVSSLKNIEKLRPIVYAAFAEYFEVQQRTCKRVK